MDFYKEPLASIEKLFHTSLQNGLTEQKHKEILEKDGPNVITKANQRSLIWIFFEQFKNLLVVLLIFAASLSLYLQSYRDAIVLFTIVLINAFIGFYQDWKSENILASIGNLLVQKCIVIRDGVKKEIPLNLLVKGDVVVLFEGDGVPADLRLISSVSLFANEFILTGESQAREKNADKMYTSDIALADRENCLYMGTTIAKGEAIGLVYGTGMETELGKIANSSMKIEQDTSPLQKEIDTLAYKITIFTLIIGAVLFAFRLYQHDSITTSLIFAIGIAAAMVPSGLPAQISIALSLGVQRLAKRNAIVKKLTSVETLGAATVIASDKTGTITKNEMTITFCRFDGHDYKITGTGFEPKGEIFDLHSKSLNKSNLGDKKIQFIAGYLASTSKINAPDEFHKTWYSIGDPTESAFACLALKAGYLLSEIDNDYKRIQLFPFDSVRKRISIIREHKEKRISFVKGSIESVLAASTHIIDHGELKIIDESIKAHLLETSKIFASNGLRIIATAYKDIQTIKESYSEEDAETDLIFSGFVSMIDPPNEAVKDAIATAFMAKVRVIMITGDNEITASAIADQIGMKNKDGSLPEIINDKALKIISDSELTVKLAQQTLIFSRVSPEEKLRIVTLLKNNGDIVAVTGDGVNDTLSLKKADIGVAMGLKGSKIAQEASSMVLLDDNFSTIVFAIEEGRTIYSNIQKNIQAILATNLAELMCVLFSFVGAIYQLPQVILAIHILLIDLIGEMIPLLALSMDIPEKTLMKNTPRKQGQIIDNKMMISIFSSGIVRGALAIGSFFMVYYANEGNSLQLAKGITTTFVTVILTQFISIISMRSESFVFSSYLFSNKYLLGGILISALATLSIVYVPFLNEFLSTTPLSMNDWKWPLLSAGVYLFVYELLKKISFK